MAEAGTTSAVPSSDACMLTPESGFCDSGEAWLLSRKLLASSQDNYAEISNCNGTPLLV